MDILLISRCPPYPLYHGDRLIPYNLMRELSGRMHQIDLLAFYQRPADLADTPFYERMFRSVQLIQEPKRSLRDYWRRYRSPDVRFPQRDEESWSPDMWHAIHRVLQDRAYDVVHLFGGVQVYEYFHLVRALPNVIVPYESYSLWLERSIERETGRFSRFVKRWQHRIASSYESWMFDLYDRVVVLTDRDSQALKALNPRIPLVTIPNGVDAGYFTPTGYEPDEPILMFTGNYDYAPNLDAALRLVREVLPLIKHYVPNARVYLVGGNPPPELLAHASDDVEITGRVPDIRTYFEYSMIFVSPLRLGAGIKNKILESMAMGTPVVATPLSCDGIPVESGKHVMIGNSDQELAQGVLRLLQDSDLRQSMRRNARQLIEELFTWQRVAERYEELYRQIIDEHRERAFSRSS